MAFRIETALSTRLPRDGDGRHHGFRPSEDIDLTDPQIHRQLCMRGWGGPEHDGTWSEATSALLRFRMAAGQDDPAAIWLSGMPFATETHFQLIEFHCDGAAIGRVRLDWALAGRQVLKLVRPEAGVGEPWVRLELRFLHASSPAREGLSGDSRLLGFKLHRIAFTAVDAPPPLLFDGPPIEIAATPTVTPAPDAVARLETRARALDAKLDVIVAELRGVRDIAEQAGRSAGRAAAALDRAASGQAGGDAG